MTDRLHRHHTGAGSAAAARASPVQLPDAEGVGARAPGAMPPELRAVVESKLARLRALSAATRGAAGDAGPAAGDELLALLARVIAAGGRRARP